MDAAKTDAAHPPSADEERPADGSDRPSEADRPAAHAVILAFCQTTTEVRIKEPGVRRYAWFLVFTGVMMMIIGGGILVVPTVITYILGGWFVLAGALMLTATAVAAALGKFAA
jgi:hypothetical protein